MAITPRSFARALAIFGLISMVACASGSPSPTVPATKPTATSSSPTKPTAAEAKPAASPTVAAPKSAVLPKEGPAPETAAPVAKPVTNSDWKTEWDRTVEAAKKEGKVIVGSGRAEAHRNAMLQFEKAYPDIKLEYTQSGGPELATRMAAERGAGRYLWDVGLSGSTTFLDSMKPKGFLAPIRPDLMLPEVLDDRSWVGGLEAGWMDKERTYIYQFDGSVNFLAYVNRDVVKESELNSIDQLVDPKWKGQITMLDPRVAGTGATALGTILQIKGEDWLRRFLSQDLVIQSEARQLAESVFRGKYPIGIRLGQAEMQPFREQGLTANVTPLDPKGQAAAVLGVGFGCVALFDRAPNPNAAKVFINWLLSKEGQTTYVKITNYSSRRLDLEANGNPEMAPDRSISYPSAGNEEALEYTQRAMNIAKQIIK